MTHQTEQDKHPLSNLEYDWITLIQNKAQALQAYDSYIRDAEQANSPECVELFKRIHQEDMRQLEEAKKHLQHVLSGQMGQQKQGS